MQVIALGGEIIDAFEFLQLECFAHDTQSSSAIEALITEFEIHMILILTVAVPIRFRSICTKPIKLDATNVSFHLFRLVYRLGHQSCFRSRKAVHWVTYIKNKDDFDKNWGMDYACHVEITAPLQSNDMSTIFWLGRSKNAVSFGAVFDAWNEGIPATESVAGKLNARFVDCL